MVFCGLGSLSDYCPNGFGDAELRDRLGSYESSLSLDSVVTSSGYREWRSNLQKHYDIASRILISDTSEAGDILETLIYGSEVELTDEELIFYRRFLVNLDVDAAISLACQYNDPTVMGFASAATSDARTSQCLNQISIAMAGSIENDGWTYRDSSHFPGAIRNFAATDERYQVRIQEADPAFENGVRTYEG